MKKWYYQMWSDGIYSLQKKREKDPTMLPWQFGSLTVVSFAEGINVLTIFFWLQVVGIKVKIFLDIDVFRIEFINNFTSSFITLFMPFFIINYFLFFF